MTRRRRALGAEGEARAARWLQRHGYRIAARNARVGGVEVDVIAQRGRVVAFVEVKTRRSDAAGAPEEAVDRRKQARLVRAATAWLAARPPGWRVRFDVVACRVDEAGAWSLRHIAGAFEAGE